MVGEPAATSGKTFEGRIRLAGELSGHVIVSARPDSLKIQGPFGELLIPYSCMHTPTRQLGGGIRVDAAGAKLWLDLDDFSDRVALFGLLQEKVNQQRRGKD